MTILRALSFVPVAIMAEKVSESAVNWIEGKLQNVEGVIHVLARRVDPLEPAAPAMSSHDFK